MIYICPDSIHDLAPKPRQRSLQGLYTQHRQPVHCVLHLLGNLVSLEILGPGLAQEPNTPQAPRPGQLHIQAFRRDLTSRPAAIDLDRLSRTPEVQPHVDECQPLNFEVRAGESCSAGKALPAYRAVTKV